jgi:hypothetical protein
MVTGQVNWQRSILVWFGVPAGADLKGSRGSMDGKKHQGNLRRRNMGPGLRLPMARYRSLLKKGDIHQIKATIAVQKVSRHFVHHTQHACGRRLT